MGNCCKGKAKSGAFRHNLDAPLLDDIMPKLPPNSQVVVVRLMSMDDIPASPTTFNGSTDGYAEMRLIPNDPVAGGQKQLSSIKPATLYPVWEPPELFQFVVSKFNDAKICISLYHYNLRDPKNSEPLGDGLLTLKNLGLTSTPTLKTVKLISPTDGKNKGTVEVMISVLNAAEASNSQEHTVYEFQRWQPVILWGHSPPPGHFFPTDPGRWCTEDGKKFDSELQYIEPPPPQGWHVSKEWYTVSTVTDPEGWQYSTDFTSPYWFPTADGSSTYYVRRRTWHREIRRGPAPPPSAAPVSNPLRGSIAGGGPAAATTTAATGANNHRNMSVGSATQNGGVPVSATSGGTTTGAAAAPPGRRKSMFAKK